MGNPFRMADCLFDACHADCVSVNQFDDVEITGCHFSFSTIGNGLTMTACSNIVLNSNLSIVNSHHGISLTSCSNGTITGNTVNNNATAATFNGIDMSNCNNLVVSGNKARNGAPGTTIGGSQQYGLNLDASCANIVVEGNHFEGNSGANGGKIKVAGGGPIRIIDMTAGMAIADVTALLPPAACNGSIINVSDSVASNAFGAILAAGGTAFTGYVHSNNTNWTIMAV
jgi:parallel beta-helix repeat protein